MYQALYRKWRPLCFADVIGQQHITDTLRAQLSTGRLSHAYLFTGTRGTGKTTCAKILARAVNCEHPVNGDPCNECPSCRGILDGSVLDVVEIDAASNNGVDNVREIRDEVRYAPSSVRKKVFIIDEVHMLSAGAFNALLKTLEEPPEHVMFILATTEIHKVPATILSRCQRFDFRRITPDAIAKRLMEIAAQEQIALTENGAKLIARLSDGAMRDALSMLDRTAGCEVVDDEAVSKSLGILGSTDTLALMEAVKTADLAAAIAEIGRAYEAGRDLSGVIDQMLGLIRDMLLIKTAHGDVSAMISPAYTAEQLKRLGEGLAPATLIAYSRILQDAAAHIKSASNRRVEAELCMIRLCTMGAQAYDSLSGRVEALEEKFKNGIPVVQKVVSVAASDNDGPPPPGDEDAPPWLQKEEQPVANDASASAEPQRADWPGWPQVLEQASGSINMGALTCLQISSRAELDNGQVLVFCEDDVTAGLAGAHPTIDRLSEIASAVAGHAVRLKVFGPDQQPQRHKQAVSDEILEKAKEFDIQVTEF